METNNLNHVLVIKVGTSTHMDSRALCSIGAQVAERNRQGLGTIIVSSGAIAAGMKATGVTERSKDMTELQRLASIGWRHNLNNWASVLGNITTGGMLVTRRELDLESERHELIEVTRTMLSHGDIVIANENDVISHEEIAFGGNDMLAATYAAKLAGSGLFASVGLILLSDIDGLYSDVNDATSVIRSVENVNDVMHFAGGAGSLNGIGGMKTKLQAAQIANDAGVTMWIANGRTDNVIEHALAGEIGTTFQHH
ncbi:MAG: glutamate 5-kinase [Candidatus Saccharibacteria bacterium]|nr:glutamate 5-kinase [Candidatus Saccharibacteria bacterium]